MKSSLKIFFLINILFLLFNVYSTNYTLDETLFVLSNQDEIVLVNLELQNSENFLDTSKEVCNIPLLYVSPYNLNGDGIKILQYEKGIAINHSDFGNRLHILNKYPEISEHATSVAGVMIGNGTINSNYVGVASESVIYGFQEDFLPFGYSYDLESNYRSGIENYSINLITNSYGHADCEVLGEYNSFTELIDEFVYGIYTSKIVPIVWAVGNSQSCNSTSGYYTIAPEASAKNIISVGDVYDNGYISFTSGFGPTDDDRIKPELVAPGEFITSTNGSNNYSTKYGTSFSAPHVSGTIALMLEQWNKSGYQTTLGDPLPSTIKALLLDSTVDLSRTGNGTQMIDGPDYVNGFGLLDAKGAVDRIINGTFIESNISEEYDLDVYAINITYQDTLKVTLAWDDIPNHNLVNDLDLYLLSPSGTKYYPWTLDPINPSDPAIQTEADHDNVVEQVYISEDEIEEGQWLIVVSSTECATTNCPQKYSLVSEYEIRLRI